MTHDMGGAAAANGSAVARRARAIWLRAILASRFSVRTHVIGLILVVVSRGGHVSLAERGWI